MTVPPPATGGTGSGNRTGTGSPVDGVGAADVLAGRSGPEDLCRFLMEVVPEVVARALAPLLPAGTGPLRARVTRTKLKPGRKLTVTVDLTGDGLRARPATVTWWRDGVPHPVRAVPEPPVTPGVRAPFSALTPPTDHGGATILVAPLDPAFPQLADVNDPARLAGVLAGAGVTGFESGLRVTPLRYRPGQRHVLLVESLDGGTRLFGKCYRDGSGPAAVEASRCVAQALSARNAPARAAHAAGCAATHGLVLWHGEEGTRLSDVLREGGAWTSGRLAHVRGAGTALRAIHDGVVPPPGGTEVCSEPLAEAAATRRALEHVAALAPRSAATAESLLSEALAKLVELPDERGHLLHGDYKCDNLLVSGERLVLLDFDRVTVGDPALDIGKLMADLRWWSRLVGRSPRALVDAFLYGYGPCPPTRVARALHYDVVFQLRAVGRRVPLHEPGWAESVEAALDVAGQCAQACRHETRRQTHQVLGARAR